MSAFQCTRTHIAAVVGSVSNYDRSTFGLMEAAGILAAENARSVAYRYRDECEPVRVPESQVEHFRFRPLEPVALLKAIQCLDYQSCECDDYANTTAAALLRQFKSAAIAALPGYDAAPWGIDEN